MSHLDSAAVRMSLVQNEHELSKLGSEQSMHCAKLPSLWITHSVVPSQSESTQQSRPLSVHGTSSPHVSPHLASAAAMMSAVQKPQLFSNEVGSQSTHWA